MHAVRKNRYVILPKDFEKGYRTNVKKPDTDFEFYKWCWGLDVYFDELVFKDCDSFLICYYVTCNWMLYL